MPPTRLTGLAPAEVVRLGRRTVLPGGSGVSFEASRAGLPPSPTLYSWDCPLLIPVNADSALRLVRVRVYAEPRGVARTSGRPGVPHGILGNGVEIPLLVPHSGLLPGYRYRLPMKTPPCGSNTPPWQLTHSVASVVAAPIG